MKKIYFLFSALIASFAVSAQCNDLFISEYIEGSSNNKALEIYNGSSNTIDLSNYAILRDNNGGTTSTDTFRMNGMLASYDVYVIANDQADALILAVADTTGRATFYNGDDALRLANLNTGTIIDAFGVLGEDPGSGWSWINGKTNDMTLLRNSSVDAGVTAWDTLEWTQTSKNDFTNLGSHNSSCAPATEPSAAASNPTREAEDVISIYSETYGNLAATNFFPFWSQGTQYEVFEIGEDSMIKYSGLDYQGIEFGSDVDASNMEFLHFDIWTADMASVSISPITRNTGERAIANTLTAGSWTSIDIPLADYVALGLSFDQVFQLKLEDVARTGKNIFVDNIYFWKEPTLVYKMADIADIVGLDADFRPVNEDTLYEVTGIVYGVDLQGPESNNRLAFTIIDATDGVGVFASPAGDAPVGGYVVNQGDEVTVKGPLGFFNGLTQIIADSIKVVSTGNTPKDVTTVTELSEDTESDLVMLEKVWLVDESLTVWPERSSTIDFTNGTDTFAVRIDSDIPGVLTKPIEFDTMNITGLGGQFTFDAPFNTGYQLLPRDSADIAEWTAPIETNVSKITNTVVSVYPNPTSGNLTVSSNTVWTAYEVYNLQGAKVLEGTMVNNTLNVNAISAGSYILRLTSQDERGVSRFVVGK